ncbi:MAG: peptide ABC transporter substrate-binding protein [Oscillospiraceae bacterium]|nr:peptide ABC transporter substrate-binding protein [Oscillospiraceae bacterium]
MIIGNLFEGLTVRQPTGELIPGAAHSWDISSDGLTYTFYLREGLYWPDENKTPLTAGDFSFALFRLFDPDTPSPYAEDFIAIKNARERLSGGRTVLIGVRPVGKYTLEIELERPDPMFLEKLSSTAAMPCNPAFFAASRGRYGLEARFVPGNGPFTLGTWDNDRFISLNKNTQYHSPENVPQSAVFHIGREDPIEQLESGRSDFARVPSEFAPTAQRLGLVMEEIEGGGSLWCIAFNMRDPVWRTTLLRQGLSMSFDRSALHGRGEELYPYTAGVYDAREAARLFALGGALAEAAMPPPLILLMPDSGGHMQYMQQLQQDWQVNLSLFPRLQEAPAETLGRRLRAGDFHAILMPVDRQEGMGSILEAIGYRNPVYDMFMNRGAYAHTTGEMSGYYASAQSQLLSDVPVIPLYFETAWYAATKEAHQHAWIYLGGRQEPELE